MHSDTHFHFKILREDEEWTRQSVLENMARSGFKFALDIGTDANDLPERLELFEKTFAAMEAAGDGGAENCAPTVNDGANESRAMDGKALAAACKKIIWLSAGIWPDADSIKNRAACLEALKKNVLSARASADPFRKKLCALGEFGLDHHWNPSGADGRSLDDFDAAMIAGERELFMAQLALAKELDLLAIIHSRDAAQETLECVKESGWGGRSVIHCYSYGLQEARAFLDLGCMISFSGSITYAKKSKMEETRALVAFVPQDRILLETDAPYLAPVPLRGKANNPNYIEHTYKFAAEAMGISEEELCQTVVQNAQKFFSVPIL